jgi:hypothetical protein
MNRINMSGVIIGGIGIVLAAIDDWYTLLWVMLILWGNNLITGEQIKREIRDGN